MNTAQVTSMIDGLCSTSSPEDFMHARDSLRVLSDYVKDAKERVDNATLEWIETHGDMVLGTVRYYRGVAKTTKCVSVRNTLNALLGIADVDTMAACLSSNAWKYAACRDVLGELYGQHFITTEDVQIKEGKPAKSLQSFDSRFAK